MKKLKRLFATFLCLLLASSLVFGQALKPSEQILEQIKILETIENNMKTAQQDLNTVSPELTQSQQNLQIMNNLYLESLQAYEQSQKESQKWKLAFQTTVTITIGIGVGAGITYMLLRRR